MNTRAIELRAARGRRRGRKIPLGRYVFDEQTGSLGWFIGYCPECDTKHILTKYQIEEFLQYSHFEQKKRGFRILAWLLHSRLL